MTSGVPQRLNSGDLRPFERLASRDPVNVLALHRARASQLQSQWLGGAMWGRFDDAEMTSACLIGPHLVPVEMTPDEVPHYLQAWSRRPPNIHISTLVGPDAAVRGFWEELKPAWGPARDERWAQPHLEITMAPQVEPDPDVRLSTLDDFDELYPACVAMYTEEVGVNPEHGTGSAYRTRVRQLIDRGWSFVRMHEGRVIFKAEVTCATRDIAQIQGVYVPPDLRGRGIARGGMAAVVNLIHERIAPTASLYVNEWNHAARATYDAVGFEQTATFATVLMSQPHLLPR